MKPVNQSVPLLWMVAMLMQSSTALSAETKSVDPKVIQERYKTVTDMTEVEREHLQRNMAEFAKLSDADQEKYRELHRQIDDDKNLSSLLQTYTAWLQTLTPGQREELRKTTDSAKKLTLVRKFKEEQYHPLESITEATPEFDPMGLRPPGQLRPWSSIELNAMMKILVQELPAEDHEKFAKATRSDQYLEILNRSIHQPSEGPRAWPSRELQEKLLGALKKSDFKNFVKARPTNQRELIVRMLFFSVRHHAWEEAGIKPPKDADLVKIESGMTTDEKTRLDKLPQDKKRRELGRLYMEQQAAPQFRHLDEIWARLSQLMSQLHLPPPRPGERLGGMEGRGDRPPGPLPHGRDGPPNGPRPPREPPPPERNRQVD